ncbi:hypothetical protein HY992_01560 [Candidatus Micrarchaeota archaeon]|nr:hypothetical protein [Candidatus Micrarchaeota archaeon]
MVRVILFVCSSKKKPSFNSKKYPHIRLSRSTLVFPECAEEELKNSCKKCRIVCADFDEGELNAVNSEWLYSKRLTVKLRGETHTSTFLRELETLEKWARFGVREEDESEFKHRKKNAEAFVKELQFKLFGGKIVNAITERLLALDDAKTAEAVFPEKNAFLVKTVSEKFDWFKQELSTLLRTPKEISEIARATEVDKSSARKWLHRMARAGIITKTRKRKGIGRPKDIYYLSHRLE